MPAQDDDADIRMLASGVVYEDNWIRLRRDQIERRDGSRGTYAFVQKRDFALVIPAEADRFCLVEEFRYPVGRRTWSFPQGGFPGRETGLRAGRLTLLGYLHCAHGTSSQGFHAYLATGLTQGEPDREPSEQDMRQRWVTRGEFKDMILNASILGGPVRVLLALPAAGPGHAAGSGGLRGYRTGRILPRTGTGTGEHG